MTKRPVWIYPIAVWVFLVTGLLFHSVKTYIALAGVSLGKGSTTSLFVSAPFCVLMLVVIPGLIQLKRWPRWIALGIFVFTASFYSEGLVNLLLSGEAKASHIALGLGVVIFDGLAFFYLIRKSFRERCAAFREERDAEAMRLYAEKQTRKMIGP